MNSSLDQILGIIIATIVAIILRWSARRWPLPGEKPNRPNDEEE